MKPKLREIAKIKPLGRKGVKSIRVKLNPQMDGIYCIKVKIKPITAEIPISLAFPPSLKQVSMREAEAAV